MMALPNAVITYLLSDMLQPNREVEQEKLAFSLWAGFTSVLGFLLFHRSQQAHSRWWEGGTLLQQVRGEWFNAYSSLIAFCSPEAAKQDAVDEFQHLLGRLMSLLFCSALQQVSPQQRDRSFEIIGVEGIDPRSLHFLSSTPDAVEVIIQWIQRSTVLNMSAGVLTVPPPVLSRVFQELSRGIVNLQNARKIADFPFPFPFAQTSVVMLLIHWIASPVIISLMLEKYVAALTSFILIFFFWCVNYISLSLEMPYGDQENDLPLDQMQSDWNRSLCTLLAKTAQSPPRFQFHPDYHHQLRLSTFAQATERIGEKLESSRGHLDDEMLTDSLNGTETLEAPAQGAPEDAPEGRAVLKGKLQSFRSSSRTSIVNGGALPAKEHANEVKAGLRPEDVEFMDPPKKGRKSSPPRAPPPRPAPREVGAMVIGAVGGSITVNGLGERDGVASPGSSSGAPSSLESEGGGGAPRRPSRSQGARGWDAGGARRGRTGPSIQCSAGCLQTLVRLRSASAGPCVDVGS